MEFRGNEDRLGKGLNRLPESIQAGDANFSVDQKISCRGEIRTNWPNSSLFRSVCLNLREAWAKRRYEAHFISKLTDCNGENSETDSSIDFARDCGYISATEHCELIVECQAIGKILGSMIGNPSGFLLHRVL